MSLKEQSSFMTTGHPPDTCTSSNGVEELRLQLEDTKAKLEQAMACNKGLYEYNVKMLTTPAKCSVRKQSNSKSANKTSS